MRKINEDVVEVAKKPENLNLLEKKWGSETINNGWTGVPNALLERQQHLKINSVELNVLLILMKYWWEPGTHPYPSKSAIGEMIGRGESTVRKTLASLEDKGFLTRDYRFREKGGQTSTNYVLDGLIAKISDEAKEINQLKSNRREQDARIRRGGKINTKTTEE